jgi:hypothetical protein
LSADDSCDDSPIVVVPTLIPQKKSCDFLFIAVM